MNEPRRTCHGCGNPIPRNPKWSRAYYATRLYCDRSCQGLNRPDIASDFITDNAGCWLWQGRMDRNGYGKAYDPSRPAGQRVDWAHRVSYRIHRGEIPPRMELDHECENTRCINPDHLAVVTRVEHVARTMARLGKDQRHQSAADMRALGLTYGEIADALGYADRASAASAVRAAVAKGLIDPESVPPAPRLDERDHDDIRALYAIGIPQTEIAAWYGIDSSHASRICSTKQGAAA